MIPGGVGKQGDGARMDWNNYEFDNEPLPESGRWKKRIRLLLIFVVIAGVTAGLIYHFRPQESTAPQEPDSSQSEAFRSGEEEPQAAPEEELLPPASAEKPLPGVTGFELVDGRTGEREELSPSPAAGEALFAENFGRINQPKKRSRQKGDKT